MIGHNARGNENRREAGRWFGERVGRSRGRSVGGGRRDRSFFSSNEPVDHPRYSRLLVHLLSCLLLFFFIFANFVSVPCVLFSTYPLFSPYLTAIITKLFVFVLYLNFFSLRFPHRLIRKQLCSDPSGTPVRSQNVIDLRSSDR